MITLKSCVNCDKKLREDEFPLAGVIKGKVYRRRKCQTCYQSVKRGRRRRIANWFEEYKKTRHCEQCLESDFRVLDL